MVTKKDDSQIYSESIEKNINDFIVLFRALPRNQQKIFKDFFNYFEDFLKKFKKEELLLLVRFINSLLNENENPKKED